MSNIAYTIFYADDDIDDQHTRQSNCDMATTACRFFRSDWGLRVTGWEPQQAKIKKEIVELLTGELQLRSKRKLIEKFINENLPYISDVDDIGDDFQTFMSEQNNQRLTI
jgi:hypothetical protein